jgi:hypothetical protein
MPSRCFLFRSYGRPICGIWGKSQQRDEKSHGPGYLTDNEDGLGLQAVKEIARHRLGHAPFPDTFLLLNCTLLRSSSLASCKISAFFFPRAYSPERSTDSPLSCVCSAVSFSAPGACSTKPSGRVDSIHSLGVVSRLFLNGFFWQKRAVSLHHD